MLQSNDQKMWTSDDPGDRLFRPCPPDLHSPETLGSLFHRDLHLPQLTHTVELAIVLKENQNR